MTLRRKLVLWYTGVFAVSGCLLAVAMSALTTHRLRSEFDKELASELDEWRAFTVEHFDNPTLLQRLIRLEIGKEHYHPTFYRLHDVSQGRDIHFIFESKWRQPIELVAKAAAIARVPESTMHTRVWAGPSRPFRVVTGPLDAKRHPR